MTNRRLLIIAIVCGLAVLLAMSPAGAILGFFIGIAFAFFVAPLIFGALALFHLPQSAGQTILTSLMIGYGVVVLLVAALGVLVLLRADPNRARRHFAVALILGTIGAVTYFSMGSLQAAWQ